MVGVNGRRAAQVVVTALALAVFGLSVYYCELRRDLLGFHTRDFPYYAQFAARVFDRAGEVNFVLNPEGTNLFGMHGFEGVGGIHRSIHFEPMKYLFGLVYYATGSTAVLFALTAFLFLLPTIYATFVHRDEGPYETAFVLVLALLYLAWPSVLPTIAYDLRPFVLLAPFYALAVLSVHYRRPLWERLLFFNLMFVAREEALVLGLCVWLYAAAATGQEPDRKRRGNALYGISWGVWMIASLLFYSWAKLDFDFLNSPVALVAMMSPLAAAALGAALLALAVSALAAWRRIRRTKVRETVEELAPLVFVLLLFALQHAVFLQSDKGLVTWIKTLLFHGQFAIYFVALWVLAPLVWRRLASDRERRRFLALLTILALLSAAVSAYYVGYILPRYRKLARQAEPVWDLRAGIDCRTTGVLCDYTTVQAFLDCPNVFVYNRLPAELVPGPERYYPEDLDVLATLIDRHAVFIAISETSRRDLARIASRTGYRFAEPEPVGSTYLLYRIDKKNKSFEPASPPVRP